MRHFPESRWLLCVVEISDHGGGNGERESSVNQEACPWFEEGAFSTKFALRGWEESRHPLKAVLIGGFVVCKRKRQISESEC